MIRNGIVTTVLSYLQRINQSLPLELRYLDSFIYGMTPEETRLGSGARAVTVQLRLPGQHVRRQLTRRTIRDSPLPKDAAVHVDV